MKKYTLGLAVLATISLGLAGCQNNQKSASSSSIKTTIKSNQYNAQALQKRYDKICDQVISPLTAIRYSATMAELKKQTAKNQQILDDINLELQNNTSVPALTKALTQYVTISKAVLTDIANNNPDTFKTDSQKFSTLTNQIAQQYFQGELPKSMVTYTKMTASTSSSTSSSN
ncbi:hypothetical protein [Lacticaseibacillus brantae]|uniref:Lipoprotein n=1 Tax=Lacticaseibacillus brantae DSM 23927 TaxID=1423727 RepID=A0A0R2B8L5_9LACO|nr:hypothetical protein [Lacticaseibacillus brantae]KRM72729.1 hypothetical protein FC34_GL000439 [Lacticaseibacillus brantae DSM 23927]